MLVTFIVLAIDQVGLYGFLFVWFFIALAAASIVLHACDVYCGFDLHLPNY